MLKNQKTVHTNQSSTKLFTITTLSLSNITRHPLTQSLGVTLFTLNKNVSVGYFSREDICLANGYGLFCTDV